jgi:hypothetical protein
MADSRFNYADRTRGHSCRPDTATDSRVIATAAPALVLQPPRLPLRPEPRSGRTDGLTARLRSNCRPPGTCAPTGTPTSSTSMTGTSDDHRAEGPLRGPVPCLPQGPPLVVHPRGLVLRRRLHARRGRAEVQPVRCRGRPSELRVNDGRLPRASTSLKCVYVRGGVPANAAAALPGKGRSSSSAAAAAARTGTTTWPSSGMSPRVSTCSSRPRRGPVPAGTGPRYPGPKTRGLAVPGDPGLDRGPGGQARAGPEPAARHRPPRLAGDPEVVYRAMASLRPRPPVNR